MCLRACAKYSSKDETRSSDRPLYRCPMAVKTSWLRDVARFCLLRTSLAGLHWVQLPTRKSSCVKARGIPTAAYQVLHLLTEVGYPPPRQGIPWLGYPHPGLTGGYPPVRVPPVQVWRGVPWPPHRGTLPLGYHPWLDLAWVPPPPPPGPGLGTPPPPPQVWTDKQSETITSRLVLRTRSVTSRCLCTKVIDGNV